MQTLYDRAGGTDALRLILTDFYDRLFGDLMIGFLFRGKDKARLVELETQYTARFLGADVAYEGRPIRQGHAASPIMRGHFERRHQILREVLAAHAVPEDVRDAWLDHSRSLLAAILGPARTSAHCDHELQAARDDRGGGGQGS